VRLNSRRDKGFLLVEWLTWMFVCGVLFFMLYTGVKAYQSVLVMAEAENAAREFAQDILLVRERALAGNDLGYIELNSGRKGYWVYRRPNLLDKKRGFASAGSAALRFSSIPSYVIRFSINGVPSTSGTYVLQHERFSSVQVHVSLQPVTGRVLIERAW